MTFNSDIKIVIESLNEFYEDSIHKKKPVINQENLEDIMSELNLEHYAKMGGLNGDELAEFLSKYFTYVTRLHHPNYLGHQCAAPHYASSLGSLINSFNNNVSSIYEMGPASVTIEYFLINWMIEKIGWEKAPTRFTKDYNGKNFSGGILVNGGSIANLTALIMARSYAIPNVWKEGNPSNTAILLPSECHYSVSKAAGIIGIGTKSIYYMDVDDRGAIIPENIPELYQKIIDEGKQPIALVANACSTAVGIYDPLDKIGDFCNEKNLWFHVDGAHGASALLSDNYKALLNGVNKANSLTWDAHKLMQTTSLCAALLVQDHKYLETGVQIQQEASYLFHEKNQPGFDSVHRTIETTKSGLGEKLFFVLGAIGEKGLSSFIDRQYDLTLDAYNYINNLDDFDCPVKPQSNILCFKIHGDDQTQLDIRNKLTSEGNFYITTVVFNGKRYMRLVFMSPSTTMNTIEDIITRITQIKKEKDGNI